MNHQKPLIGVKGRLQNRSYEKDDVKKYITEVIADKVTFLSTNKKAGETVFDSNEKEGE